MGMKSTAGEIIQVQGGHIVRSTGRKDRHSKVYTAKGARDRRVRLAAHTAIQFYDVQDRLGYDRPSKAVDWLIKKAKSAIDKLAELPPWHPTGNNNNIPVAANPDPDPDENSSEIGIGEQSQSPQYNFQLQRHLGENPDDNNSSLIPQHLDSESIADTMKSFFPTSSANSSLNFQSYPPDIISRNSNQTQDLCLSLQSFQDPGLISQGNTSHTPQTDHTLFAGSNSVPFEANYQRMLAWNNDPDTESRGGFLFNSPPMPLPLLGQGSAFTQRGPLQSSFAPSVRAWNDISMHQNSIFGNRFVSDGLPRFFVPARIHGEEQQQHDNDPSSASPSSQH